MNDYWCIPPKESAEFVTNMEDIFDIYEVPYNSELPVVCMDEKPYQCLSDVPCETLSLRPGDNQKIDYEYVREGTCSIFIITEPLRGWLHSNVRKTRTTLDWAEEIKYLLTECYPDHSNAKFGRTDREFTFSDRIIILRYEACNRMIYHAEKILVIEIIV